MDQRRSKDVGGSGDTSNVIKWQPWMIMGEHTSREYLVESPAETLEAMKQTALKAGTYVLPSETDGNMRSKLARAGLAKAHRFQAHPYWLSRCDLCGVEEWEHPQGPAERVFAWSIPDMLEGTTFWMQYEDFASFGESTRWSLWVRTKRRIMCVSDPHVGLTLSFAEVAPSTPLGCNELRGVREAASCPA